MFYCNTGLKDYLIVNFFFVCMISGPLIVILDAVDNVIFKVCPFVAAGIVVGSIYWTAVTYGAVTVMQVSSCSDCNCDHYFIIFSV